MNSDDSPRTALRWLRAAIQTNRVSFPSQAPAFVKQPRMEIQRRMVVLYLVRGWSCARIGKRYGLTRQRVQQLIKGWVEPAIELGYIQTIPRHAR
jgi:hypothetical protein